MVALKKMELQQSLYTVMMYGCLKKKNNNIIS
jgi:hypothetical protein